LAKYYEVVMFLYRIATFSGHPILKSSSLLQCLLTMCIPAQIKKPGCRGTEPAKAVDLTSEATSRQAGLLFVRTQESFWFFNRHCCAPWLICCIHFISWVLAACIAFLLPSHPHSSSVCCCLLHPHGHTQNTHLLSTATRC
jgi:hypothetical protein